MYIHKMPQICETIMMQGNSENMILVVTGILHHRLEETYGPILSGIAHTMRRMYHGLPSKRSNSAILSALQTLKSVRPK